MHDPRTRTLVDEAKCNPKKKQLLLFQLIVLYREREREVFATTDKDTPHIHKMLLEDDGIFPS